MKNILLLFICFTITGIAQNSVNKNNFEEKIIRLKKQDNLEEYLYTYFDKYIKTKDFNFLIKGIDSTWRKTKNNNEKIALLHLKINIGYYYFNEGNISKSVKSYENALLYYQTNNIKNYEIIKYCLKPLANNYSRLGDYQRAKSLYKYTLETALKTNNQKALIGTYLNLSILFQSTNNNKEAIALLEKALKNKNLSSKQKKDLQIAIAKNQLLIGNYSIALLMVGNLKNNYQVETIKGLCYFNMQKLILAEKHLKKAIGLLKLTNYSKRELAKTYNILAQIQINKKELKNALSTYNKSYNTIIYGKDFRNNLFAENTFLEIFEGKAIIYSKQNKLQKAIESYQQAFKIAELLQITKSSQQSKIIQQQENRKRSEKMVALYYQLYSKNQKIEFIEKAFETVEMSKSMVLLERLKYQYAKKSSNMDSLFLKEQLLEKEQAILSKKIVLEELNHENININLIKYLTYQRTKIITKLTVLKTQIKQKYPFLNNELKPITVKTIKEQLLYDNQQLIEFFDTEKAVFRFSITKTQDIQWTKITKDTTYNNTLKSYINLFASNNGNHIKNEVETYQKSAYFLYASLLKNVLSTTKITIIPDGKLNFVPFDALLTNDKPYNSFEKLSYLLYKKELNYGYSATILLQQKENLNRPTKQKSVIGFFPLFENNYRDLQELTYTLEEKKALNNFNNSLIFEKEQATKEYFFKWVNNYKIIHLSTHASAGNFEEPAHIEFRDKTLYLPEIYGLNLKSDLLILSACETGIGKLQKGEGAMSLARGFSYTGIKNLLVSQWKVNDKSTSILIQNFYKDYTNSKNISNALHQAKLDYLQNKNIDNLKKTPYYWAGFVFIGNTETTNTSNSYLWFLLIIFGVIGLFLTTRKIRS